MLAATTSAFADSLHRLEALDHTRGSTVPPFGPRKHKEWHHFVVLAPETEVLVNFSCCDDPSPRRGTPTLPRLVLLARDTSWHGDVETFAPRESYVASTGVRFDLGGNHLDLESGAYSIRAATRSGDVRVDMQLVPRVEAILVPSTPMHDGPPLHWVVLPRLDAFGWLTIDGRRTRIDGAPAYHDHNWGHFLWGHDLSWEWGFVLPDDPATPWSMTFVRLTNRLRTITLDQKFLVWRGSRLAASFREGEVATTIGPMALRPRRVTKVPRAMALLVPELAIDIPTYFANYAQRGADRVSCDTEPFDLVQVLIPNETDLGATIFNEVSARVRVSGEIAGEPFHFSGRAMMEMIRHV